MWFFIAALIGHSVLVESNKVDVKCPDSGHYIHVKPLTHCREYYSCNNGTVVTSGCPQGTIFSSIDKTCKASGNCHELVCTGRIDGKYADPTENCNRIYKCSAGKLSYVQTCAKDGAKCSGIQRENKCPSIDHSTAIVVKKRDICKTRKNGFYALNDCLRYVKCLDGREVSLQICIHGTKFNGTSCVENFKCGTCLSRNDGFYPDENTNCKEYVFCKNQHVVARHRCPSGTVYNGASCIVSSTYVCPTIKVCQGSHDGLHADYSRDCSSYFECYKGTLIYEKSCPVGEIFNGTNCVLQNQFFCQGPYLSFDCFGRKGFFFDVSSGCSKYHFCNFGNKTVFKCPENKIFNGTYCVPSSQFRCPKEKSNSCEGKSVGYHQDTKSNCQSYYFCLEGNKITYVCPQGKVFNGQECVNSLLYACPYKDADCLDKAEGYHLNDLNKKEFYFCKNGSKLITFSCAFSNASVCTSSATPENICSQVKRGYVTDINCRVYHICSNHNLIDSGVCDENRVFNGKTCASKNSFQCPVQRKSCKELSNGFYQDFESGCKKYFSCINGEKSEYYCPEGKLHNGDLCVAKTGYKCPIFFSNENTIHL